MDRRIGSMPAYRITISYVPVDYSSLFPIRRKLTPHAHAWEVGMLRQPGILLRRVENSQRHKTLPRNWQRHQKDRYQSQSTHQMVACCLIRLQDWPLDRRHKIN